MAQGMRLTETTRYFLASVVKNVPHVPAHERTSDCAQGCKRQRVGHFVVDNGAVAHLCKPMPMFPQRVWTAQLYIGKAIWRIPGQHQRFPRKRQAVQAEIVIDDAALRNGRWCAGNGEVQ